MGFQRAFRNDDGGGRPDDAAARAHAPTTPLPALTSLRFFAAFYVLVFHYDRFFFPDGPRNTAILLGHTGVTFFFVLSGFILAYTYHAVDFGDRIVRRRYLLARFARIYPAFLLSLAISLPWFAAWVLKSEPPLKWLMASGAVLAPLGLHAWVPGAACSLNCASWSISVEAFFYLLFPLLLPLVLRRPVEYALAALGLWAVFGAFGTLLWNRYAPGVSLIEPEPAGATAMLLAQGIKYDPLLRLPEFIAGLVLFAWWQRMRPAAPPDASDRRGSLAKPFLGAAALAAIVLVLIDPYVPGPLMHNGLSALAWAPLILAGAELRGGILASAPLVFLGRISFALYLLHLPAYAAINSLDRALHGAITGPSPWLGVALATALSLALAALVHLYVEEPARRALLGGGLRLFASRAEGTVAETATQR
ncbi:acyltransferase family protein [Methylobacterium brachythecii]|uniref:Acyltransferase n=1 Tax=Methylobacterium brachythecii TaxID=1176177 RepID=A0A7W6AHG5_9HYPH|nr:acyltransferase [Methylobacterium brachythecii]MBB3902411.1 peptidoglycan/LPS O-acetylase OafA/YrhL [Methylobacterium brachythecii]GLS42260.1 acyltransferase [Methylobacterium brachythecii]